MKRAKLKPCPCCGSTNIDSAEKFIRLSLKTGEFETTCGRIYCLDCGIMIEGFEDTVRLRHWNRRPKSRPARKNARKPPRDLPESTRGNQGAD